MVSSIKGILKLARALSKGALNKQMTFVSEYWTKAGQKAGGPIMSIAEPIATGRAISRRDFLGRTGKGVHELKLQAQMLKAGDDLQNTQTAAQAWLKRQDIQARIRRLRKL